MKKTFITTLIIFCLSLLLAFGLTACDDKPCTHTYDNACDATCNKCNEERTVTHSPNDDDGDCTTEITCSECGATTTPAKESHTGGISTCTEKAVCTACGTAYGELNPDNHTFDDGVCACGIIDATEMTADELNTAVTELLAAGKTDITVTLKPDADADEYLDNTSTMQYAIRSALRNSTVADGSVNLTIQGLNAVLDGFLGTSEYWDEKSENHVEESAVTKVKSITLTDATEIGYDAFMNCTSLVSVSAPNVSYIALEAFAGCTSLETLSLTTEKEIALGKIGMVKEVFGDPSISGQVKLILHPNKQADVTENTFARYTFEAVAYTCTDGTTTHSVGDVAAYLWNEDYSVCSAGYACAKCSYVDLKETSQATLEAVTENSTAHSAAFTSADFEAQTKAFGYIYDSATNTYSVWDEDGLNMWRLAVAENYATNLTLMDDITLSTSGITVDKNGKPSGSNWTFVYRFEGTLDGNGHSIVNLRIYDEFNAYFIGIAIDATIRDITLVNPVVYGEYTYTAGLVSQIAFGTSLINCHVQGGSITSEMTGVGGLVGTVSYDTNYIYGCTNSAKVTGTNRVGGIIGSGGTSLSNGVIVSCANFGEISGNKEVGGIIGDPASSDKVIGCYTTDGYICGDTNATITDCYYASSEDTDEEDGTTAVTDVNTAEVVNAMNAAIDTYNSTATVKCNYLWEIGTNGNPILVEITE